MKMLVRGLESTERINLLLSLTRINSEPIIRALHDYLVNGRTDTGAAAINMVEQSNFNRALSKLNEVAGTVEKIKDLDWQHLEVKSVK